jgi:CheY-like chemotaxis protein
MSRVPVTIGPVPAASATAWARTARRTIAAVRERPDLGIPEDVIASFEYYVSQWSELAASAVTFRWTDDVDVHVVRKLAGYWALLANAARQDDHPTGVEPAPPEAQPFYDALVGAMAAVLAAGEDEDRFAEKFDEVAPPFRPDGAEHPVVERPTRVLLVDDTDDIRLLFRIALENDPRFEVWGEAANGQEALDLIADACPDVVVLDVAMPVMDGLTALPLLRDRCPQARVVVVTATATREIRESALRLGARAVLEKRGSLEDLKRTVGAP